MAFVCLLVLEQKESFRKASDEPAASHAGRSQKYFRVSLEAALFAVMLALVTALLPTSPDHPNPLQLSVAWSNIESFYLSADPSFNVQLAVDQK
eukprot:1253410-Amphidinium_carterae.1